MIDLYLKDATREELFEKLIAAGFMIKDFPDYKIEGVFLDDIGQIDEVAGYHVNLRLAEELTEEQTALLADTILITPETPCRVWA